MARQIVEGVRKKLIIFTSSLYDSYEIPVNTKKLVVNIIDVSSGFRIEIPVFLFSQSPIPYELIVSNTPMYAESEMKFVVDIRQRKGINVFVMFFFDFSFFLLYIGLPIRLLP